MPKFSIITIVYNEERYLADAIEFCLGQSNSNCELIIVNDCSVDRTLAIAQEYAECYSNITVVSHEYNAGMLPARRIVCSMLKMIMCAFLGC